MPEVSSGRKGGRVAEDLRSGGIIAALIAFGLFVGLLSPASAFADGVIRNVETGRCLYSNDAGHVFTVACNPADRYQLWIPNSGDIINQRTGRCLENQASFVWTARCNGSNSQWWIPTGAPGLFNVATQRCLDSNYNGDVYALGCNGGNFQKWVGGGVS